MKKALLIGINYVGTSNELAGCQNDILDVQKYLQTRGYAINILMDHSGYKAPSSENIIAAMREFATGVAPGDQLYFHYSGHGSHINDTSGDERDGQDECICPQRGSFIIDDKLYAEMVAPLPAGATLCAVFDSCHSGSVLDLPHRWTKPSFYRENNNKPAADVISISGCKDSQMSADSAFNGRPNGALTHAFLQCLQSDASKPLTWKKLISRVNGLLHTQYSQVAQLCCSKKAVSNAVVNL